jgi:hypothetical protein
MSDEILLPTPEEVEQYAGQAPEQAPSPEQPTLSAIYAENSRYTLNFTHGRPIWPSVFMPAPRQRGYTEATE